MLNFDSPSIYVQIDQWINTKTRQCLDCFPHDSIRRLSGQNFIPKEDCLKNIYTRDELYLGNVITCIGQVASNFQINTEVPSSKRFRILVASLRTYGQVMDTIGKFALFIISAEYRHR